MIKIGKIYVDPEIRDIKFSCDYTKCKSFCCKGKCYAGAPLNRQESLFFAEYITDDLLSFLSKDKKEKIAMFSGVKEIDGKMFTDTMKNGDCVFLGYHKMTPFCAFEKCFELGLSSFKKPISCRLFPLKIVEYINKSYLKFIFYPECKSALNSQVPLVRFLKAPLTEYFGERWYMELMSRFDVEL